MILAIIQARMSSTRLFGKVLLPIAGKPILGWVIDAAKASHLVDRVVVATSKELSDDPILAVCKNMADVYRGDLHDVLGRFYGVALHEKPLHIVRLTADCPALRSQLIDQTIWHHLDGNFDYTRASVHGGWADGHDVEVFTYQALTRAAKLAIKPQDREHVTSYMYDQSSVGFWWCDYQNLKGPDTRKLSVDTWDDYHRVREELEKEIEHPN